MTRFIGLFLLLIAVAVVVGYLITKQGDEATAVNVTGLVGSQEVVDGCLPAELVVSEIELARNKVRSGKPVE